MTRVVETKGRSHVFTLKDGSVMRLQARASQTIDDSLVSESLKEAEKRGIIYMVTSVEKMKTPENVSGKKEGK